MSPQTLQEGTKETHPQANFTLWVNLGWVISYQGWTPTATNHKWLSFLNLLYSQIHVTEAQLAIEVFSNITAKPHSLQTKRKE